MTHPIHIAEVGIVCEQQPGGRYVGVTTAQGFLIAFVVERDEAHVRAVTRDAGYSLDITWRGVTVTGAGDTLSEAYEEAEDSAASFVPRLHAELVALEWAAYVARREERQAREAEGADEVSNG